MGRHAVVVGAGLAGLRTAQALRRNGWTGLITLVGAEPHPPYDRPPLSKGYLLGELAEARLALVTQQQLADQRIGLRLGAPATGLDAAAHRLHVGGDVIDYDVLVLATGSSPHDLPPSLFPDGPLRGVHVLRSLGDATAIRDRLSGGTRVVVVGGGFVGAEVAATCRALGLDVTVVDALDGLMIRGLGPQLGAAAAVRHAAHGVRLFLGRQLRAVRGSGDVAAVELDDGTELPADLVVAGLGAAPATQWLAGSGLPVDDGVLCDATLAVTGAPDLFAVGDVARWYVPRYGTTLRAEHWTAAGEQAAAVGRTVCGSPTEYDPVPYVWSDQFGVRLQVFGRLRPEHEVVVLSGDPCGERFVAASGGEGRLQGVVALGAVKAAVRLRALLLQGAAWAPGRWARDVAS